MIDKEAKNIDAVTVGTPDHIHAVAVDGGDPRGQARLLPEAAHPHAARVPRADQGREGRRRRRPRWATRGTPPRAPGSPTSGSRPASSARCARSTSGPTAPGRSGSRGSAGPPTRRPVPSTLDWDLWLGPIRERPYHPAYAPVSWRGWRDFGTGALGDMGCHIIDHPVWALDLGAPTSVEASATLDGSVARRQQAELRDLSDRLDHHLRIPRAGHAAARADDLVRRRPDAARPPPRCPPASACTDNGVLYVGSKGKMHHGSHGGMPQLLPAALHEQAKAVPKTMTRSPGHYEEWLLACKGGPRPVSNFDYAGPLTEIVLLGVLALLRPGKRLEWDSANLKVKNAPELNHVRPHRVSQGLDALIGGIDSGDG